MAAQTEASFPLPRVHMNGTSRTMLQEGYLKAHDAVEMAVGDLAAVEFNARDYYVISDDAFVKARAKRDEMLVKLREVQQYLEAHLQELY